jgi:putative ABC transport system substrate-binding protein
MSRHAIGLIVTRALSFLWMPSASSAQPGEKVWRIGLFHVGLDHIPPSLSPLRDALKALGYEEGKNLHLDWRNLPDEDAARQTAREFFQQPVDVIVAFENQTVRAAKAATAAIPVVFLHVTDPEAAGFIHSLAHPGGNLTGDL